MNKTGVLCVLMVTLLFFVSCGSKSESTAEIMTKRLSVLKEASTGPGAGGNPITGKGMGREDWTTMAPVTPGNGGTAGRIFLEIPNQPVDVPNGAVILRSMPAGDFDLQVMVENLAKNSESRAGITLMRSPGSHLDFLFFLKNRIPTVLLDRVEGDNHETITSASVGGAPLVLRFEYRDGRVTPYYRLAAEGSLKVFESIYYPRSPLTSGQVGLIGYGKSGDAQVFNEYELTEKK